MQFRSGVRGVPSQAAIWPQQRAYLVLAIVRDAQKGEGFPCFEEIGRIVHTGNDRVPT